MVRTSELIETPWSEIEEGRPDWTIPWHRMKLGKCRLNPIKKGGRHPSLIDVNSLACVQRGLT
jgi:hypothetical protein